MRNLIKSLVIFGALAGCVTAVADPPSKSSSQRQSFEEFRKGILSDYSDFRKTLLDRYADFLNGEWHEYESLNAEKRDRTPKPATPPMVASPKPSPASQPAAKPTQPVAEPTQPASRPDPISSPQHSAEGASPKSEKSGEQFSFYGLPVEMPQIDYSITDRLYSNADYAANWRKLDKANVADLVLPSLRRSATDMGLNDYLTYRLISDYVDARFPKADASSRMSTIHYLLANLGYDARIAVTTTNIPLLLIPFDQTVYGRVYMLLDGKKYYMFAPEGVDLSKMGGVGVSTCRLPDDVDAGRAMSLTLGKLNIPYKPHHFDLSHGPIHISGDVNANLMPILYRYPQMPIGGYAQSVLEPELRAKLSAQISSQLASMESDEAAESLLEFMHNVFEYSTDEDFHGFEKPYFLEETLFYPKNDCEDRAIFYTYFLFNALGKEAQLVSFPGHEAATVRLDNPVSGANYKYHGETFTISDPTYIGSHTGMVMPQYRNETPNIDYTYKK